ncbi:Flp pilus assembly protein CpaB [Arthrobacter pigmenti]
MKSRLLAGVAAVILALVGAFLVFSYAQNSDARAMAGMEPVSVLVVQKPVPAGTKTEALAESVTVEQLPASAVSKSALKDLQDAAGKVTAVDLVAGEQLLSKRLIDPEDLEASGSIEVPKGLQEVSFLLEPQRAVGGNVGPGDLVGINISYEEGPPEGAPTTRFVYHKVLLTNVQRAPAPSAEGAEGTGQDTAAALPEGSLLLTVAVDDAKTARIVHGSEFGTLWLTKEPGDASESDNGIITTTEVYE